MYVNDRPTSPALRPVIVLLYKGKPLIETACRYSVIHSTEVEGLLEARGIEANATAARREALSRSILMANHLAIAM